MTEGLTLEQHRELRDVFVELIGKWDREGKPVPRALRNACRDYNETSPLIVTPQMRERVRASGWDD